MRFSINFNRDGSAPVCRVPKSGVAPKCVFGVSLQTLRQNGKTVNGIPLVLRDMVEFLEKNAMDYEDLFRGGCSVVKIHQLRRRLDYGEKVKLELEHVNTVASLLKLFFQQLPDPVVPEYQRRLLVQTFSGTTDEYELTLSLKKHLCRIPDDNLIVLLYIANFLSRVAACSELNRMTVDSLATIFGPCIFHVPAGPKMLEEHNVCNTVLVHLLRKHKIIPLPTGMSRPPSPSFSNPF
ncbi:protein FAM13A-like isoform X1 [Syngnathus scovelli]|uniref:protein FAM13A-like isoform X1 n=1 Tax=Syngnathus scovelli TaxID=161590 RepID=UPI002110291D|nr:protein FAM13A-like isoform X1 [Syngnathus scovelli]